MEEVPILMRVSKGDAQIINYAHTLLGSSRKLGKVKAASTSIVDSNLLRRLGVSSDAVF